MTGRVGLVALLVLAGCAHEVIEVDAEAPPIATPSVPLPLTVAVREGSFERSHLNPGGVMTHFADELRASRVFQGVMYPVPRGAEPRWEIQLAAVDGGSEPDSNFYKSAVASALFPLACFIWLENGRCSSCWTICSGPIAAQSPCFSTWVAGWLGAGS